ncbi:RnfABCDGE type electron transport complex subunit B [Pantoea sp. SoEX]|uniref:RnfABCDGE type electron transport complex subunit B n=1 Tax=Pantoea sp. SoEX TaxID=2576763 RepID=UPI0013595743|nr:RnfABCDGE type electron transport complex subunit B [Pantoea sp. SoEX]MXP50956.1 RnfABCDGE type electron transport complex subunit B [Pantoea sp. SoEX]
MEIKKILSMKSNISEINSKNIAFIEENNCIGCNKCAQICPVQAIVGFVRTTHTVISNQCTNCNLCIDYCPVNCIKIISSNILMNNFEWNVNNTLVKLNVICNEI